MFFVSFFSEGGKLKKIEYCDYEPPDHFCMSCLLLFCSLHHFLARPEYQVESAELDLILLLTFVSKRTMLFKSTL